MALSEWQAQVGSFVVGAGTAYPFDGPITGLGVPSPRTSDLDKGDQPGVFGGRDVPSKRTIGLSVAVLGADAAAVMDSIDTLNAAWAPTSTDTNLDICLPGMGTRTWTGRPRGVDLDLTYLAYGAARARLTFDALDPDGAPVGP